MCGYQGSEDSGEAFRTFGLSPLGLEFENEAVLYYAEALTQKGPRFVGALQ